MLNIVIPMAGKGSRFVSAGYEVPKPLIDINGKHMIEVVINNLTPVCEHHFIFVCQKEHVEKYNLKGVFENSCASYDIVILDEVTDGAAETVLKARDIIDSNDQLMIANSDQWVDIDINTYLQDLDERQLDGSMLTMKADDAKWSYAKVNSQGLVTEVIEKVVVSDEATVGVYNFVRGADFCKYADEMISRNIRSNGEFYVAPVYTYMARSGLNIGYFNIGSDGCGMYGLGTPEDLDIFLCSSVLDKATK